MFDNDHRVHYKHTKYVVTAMVSRLKTKHPTALLTLEYVEVLADIICAEGGCDPEGDFGFFWDDKEYNTDVLNFRDKVVSLCGNMGNEILARRAAPPNFSAKRPSRISHLMAPVISSNH